MYLVVVSDRVVCTCAGDSKRVEEFCRGRNAKKLIPRGLLCRGGAALVTPPTIRADYSKLSGKLRRCATPPSSGAKPAKHCKSAASPTPQVPATRANPACSPWRDRGPAGVHRLPAFQVLKKWRQLSPTAFVSPFLPERPIDAQFLAFCSQKAESRERLRMGLTGALAATRSKGT